MIVSDEMREAEQVLMFSLESEVFAIPVRNVNEIIDPLPVTRAPNAHPSSPGLVNVRGSITPVIDLRYRLGMRPGTISETSRMLVVDLIVNGEKNKVGVLVDDVDDIAEIKADRIEGVPQLGANWPPDLIQGALQWGDKFIIIIDVESAFIPSPETC